MPRGPTSGKGAPAPTPAVLPDARPGEPSTTRAGAALTDAWPRRHLTPPRAAHPSNASPREHRDDEREGRRLPEDERGRHPGLGEDERARPGHVLPRRRLRNDRREKHEEDARRQVPRQDARQDRGENEGPLEPRRALKDQPRLGMDRSDGRRRRTPRDASALLVLLLPAFVPCAGGSLTPARRAFERPMAMACLAERAPCFPSRTCRISS